MTEGKSLGNNISPFVATVHLPRNNENSTSSARIIVHKFLQ